MQSLTVFSFPYKKFWKSTSFCEFPNQNTALRRIISAMEEVPLLTKPFTFNTHDRAERSRPLGKRDNIIIPQW